MKFRDASRLTNAALMQVDFVSLSPLDTLRDVIEEMAGRRDRYAVVEWEDRFLGLVCDRDLRLALPSRFEQPGPHPLGDVADETTVMAICIRQPISAHPQGAAIMSAQLMLHKRIGCLPIVCPQSSRVLGLLTLSDFARAFAALSSGPVVPALMFHGTDMDAVSANVIRRSDSRSGLRVAATTRSGGQAAGCGATSAGD